MTPLIKNLHKSASFRQVLYFSVTAIIFSLVLYSCRKYDLGFDFDEEEQSISESGNLISPFEIKQWEKKLEVTLPFKAKWNLAKQRVIKGKSMVRVPVSEYAYLLFTKDKKNTPIKAYLYKVHNEKPNEKKFTGDIEWFSFQDYEMRGQKIVNDRAGKPMIFKGKDNIQPLIKKAQQAKSKPLQTTTKSLNDFIVVLTARMQALHCWVSYSDYTGILDISCSNGYWEWWYVSESSYGGGGSEGSEGDGDIGTILGGTMGGGAICNCYDNLFWWEYKFYSDDTLSILGTLNLTETQADWVNTNGFSTYIKYYLEHTSLPDAEKRAIAINHLDKLMADAAYSSFVYNYHINEQTMLAWWENEDWLHADNNAYNVLTNGYFEDLDFIDKFLSTWYTISQYRTQMHNNELTLFDAMSTLDQITYLQNAGLSSGYARLLFPTSGSNQVNDKADAYRHALFSLLNKQSFGISVAETMGNAHEDWVGNPPLEKEMDLFNNDIGRNSNNSNSLTLRPLIIWNLIKNGSLKYINANGALIFTNQ